MFRKECAYQMINLGNVTHSVDVVMMFGLCSAVVRGVAWKFAERRGEGWLAGWLAPGIPPRRAKSDPNP